MFTKMLIVIVSVWSNFSFLSIFSYSLSPLQYPLNPAISPAGTTPGPKESGSSPSSPYTQLPT